MFQIFSSPLQKILMMETNPVSETLYVSLEAQRLRLALSNGSSYMGFHLTREDGSETDIRNLVYIKQATGKGQCAT
jgi:hypothetical protein